MEHAPQTHPVEPTAMDEANGDGAHALPPPAADVVVDDAVVMQDAPAPHAASAAANALSWEKLESQRRQLEEQTATLMALIDRQKALTGASATHRGVYHKVRRDALSAGVHPLKGVATTVPEQRTSELRVRLWRVVVPGGRVGSLYPV